MRYQMPSCNPRRHKRTTSPQTTSTSRHDKHRHDMRRRCDSSQSNSQHSGHRLIVNLNAIRLAQIHTKLPSISAPENQSSKRSQGCQVSNRASDNPMTETQGTRSTPRPLSCVPVDNSFIVPLSAQPVENDLRSLDLYHTSSDTNVSGSILHCIFGLSDPRVQMLTFKPIFTICICMYVNLKSESTKRIEVPESLSTDHDHIYTEVIRNL
ncbi:hypothetical protein C8Q75DRAFT_759067, partial [Abortiporus biennis]